jgi:uncharacterized protein (TIGR02145 family)
LQKGTTGYWWSSTENNTFVSFWSIFDDGELINPFPIEKEYGFSVRCVKD